MQDSEVLQVREKAIEKKESSDLATYWRLADRADGYVVGDFQVSRINKGRPAQPPEIAGPALFLASNDASYINGSSLIVDGAWATSGYPDMRPFRGPIQWNG